MPHCGTITMQRISFTWGLSGGLTPYRYPAIWRRGGQDPEILSTSFVLNSLRQDKDKVPKNVARISYIKKAWGCLFNMLNTDFISDLITSES